MRKKTLAHAILACLMLATMAATTPVVSAGSCTDEDQSNGVGGQQVGCEFVCNGPGTVTVEVEADDPDATVSGTGSCPGGSARCTGEKSCTDSAPYRESGEGSCSADSDEAIDSGLWVGCTAVGGSPSILPCPPFCRDGGGGGGGWLGIPCPICVSNELLDSLRGLGPVLDPKVDLRFDVEPSFIDPALIDTASSNGSLWQDLERMNPDWAQDALEANSYVLMYHKDGNTLGISCTYGTCYEFLPLVTNDENGFHMATP